MLSFTVATQTENLQIKPLFIPYKTAESTTLDLVLAYLLSTPLEVMEHVSDLPNLIWQWAQEFARRHGTTCEWYDLFAKRGDMSDYREFKIGVNVTNVRYDARALSNEMPGWVVEDTSTNDTDAPQLSVFRQRKTTVSTFKWTMKEAIKTGEDNEKTINIGVPPVVASRIYLSTDLAIGSTTEVTKTEEQNWNIERHVTVPVRSKVDMIWTINEEGSLGVFSADVVITGHVAIWLTDETDINTPDGDDEHYLWFLKITLVFEQMRDYGIQVPEQYSIRSGSVIFRVTGECRGESGYDSEYSLVQTNLNSSKVSQPRCVNQLGVSTLSYRGRP